MQKQTNTPDVVGGVFCSEEQNQAQAKLVFDFDRTYNEKIVKCEARLTARPAGFLSDGDEENARIYAVHLTSANQSEIRRAYPVSVLLGSVLSFIQNNDFQQICMNGSRG